MYVRAIKERDEPPSADLCRWVDALFTAAAADTDEVGQRWYTVKERASGPLLRADVFGIGSQKLSLWRTGNLRRNGPAAALKFTQQLLAIFLGRDTCVQPLKEAQAHRIYTFWRAKCHSCLSQVVDGLFKYEEQLGRTLGSREQRSALRSFAGGSTVGTDGREAGAGFALPLHPPPGEANFPSVVRPAGTMSRTSDWEARARQISCGPRVAISPANDPYATVRSDGCWRSQFRHIRWLIKTGNYGSALDALQSRRYILNDPTASIAHYYSALCYNRLANYDMALNHASFSDFYLQTWTGTPALPVYIDYQICHALAQSGQHVQCIKYIKNLRELSALGRAPHLGRMIGWINVELFKSYFLLGDMSAGRIPLLEAKAIFDRLNDVAGLAQIIGFHAQYQTFDRAAWDDANKYYAQALLCATDVPRLKSTLLSNASANRISQLRYDKSVTRNSVQRFSNEAKRFARESIEINSNLGIGDTAFSVDEHMHAAEGATFEGKVAEAQESMRMAMSIKRKEGFTRNPRRSGRLFRAQAVMLSKLRLASDEDVEEAFNRSLSYSRHKYPRIYLETLVDRVQHRRSRRQDASDILSEIRGFAISGNSTVYSDALQRIAAA